MTDEIHQHFENNENFLLCCFTKEQYEYCLKWCYGNGYLTDSEYKKLTDIDIFDRFNHEVLLEQDFKDGGRCIHFKGSHYMGIDSYAIYKEVKERGVESDLEFYSFVDEINECTIIKSSVIYYCGSCGTKLFGTEYIRCPFCHVRFTTIVKAWRSA